MSREPHAPTLAALDGDPWAEAAAEVAFPEPNPLVNRLYAVRAMRLDVMAEEAFVADAPRWARTSYGISDFLSVRHNEHGFADHARGVFRKQKE